MIRLRVAVLLTAAAAPPPASVTTHSSTVRLARSSYCWPANHGTACADYMRPRCGDGRTPNVAVLVGESIRFRLGFHARSASVDFLGSGGGVYNLRPGETLRWRVKRLGVFVLASQGESGDASYAGCLARRR